ncbi:MAG: hypothetical protein ACTSUE_16895 [Promethearchaeota archaeon]
MRSEACIAGGHEELIIATSTKYDPWISVLRELPGSFTLSKFEGNARNAANNSGY